MQTRDPQHWLTALQARQEALRRITSHMTRQVELDPRPVFEVVLAEAAQALGAPMACLHIYDSESRALARVAGYRLDPVWARAWSRLAVPGETPPARAQDTGQCQALFGPQAPAGLAGVVSSPVRGAQLTVGALSLLWPSPGPPAQQPDPECNEFLEITGHLLGLAIEHHGLFEALEDQLDEVRSLQQQAEERNRELAGLNARLAELSITDGLTGLFNRRHFLQRLEEETARAQRQGHPLCLIMADLDHFKRVNDELGHLTGDHALREFAAHLRAGVRKIDLVGRYGGEEFALVLLDCDLAKGRKVAEKLRVQVQTKTMHPPFAALGGLTVSLGVAQLGEAMQAEGLIAAADRALYRAKEGGRNRVETA